MLSESVPLLPTALYPLPASSEENQMLSMKTQPIQNILSGTPKSLPEDGKVLLRPLAEDTGRPFYLLPRETASSSHEAPKQPHF